MALMIDTPLWPWRGQLWAHMISDDSLDELHAAARRLGLRWVSFGRDHYDVPETKWPAACEEATVVDPRHIVRSLRRSGLRASGGKSAKHWKWTESLPPELATEPVTDWLREVAELVDDAAIDVLHRPEEHVVIHLLKHDDVPALDSLREPPVPGSRVIETVSDGRYSVELVLPHGLVEPAPAVDRGRG